MPLEVEKREEISINAILQEIRSLDDAMRELLLSADRSTAGAGALIVTGLTLFVTKNLPAALIILPYALTVVMFFMLQKFIDRQLCGGTRRWLEEAINIRMGQSICQTMIVRSSVPRPDEAWAGIVYAVGGLATVSLSLFGIRSFVPPKSLQFMHNFWPLHLLGLILCALLLNVARLRMESAEGEAYAKASLARLDLPQQ